MAMIYANPCPYIQFTIAPNNNLSDHPNIQKKLHSQWLLMQDISLHCGQTLSNYWKFFW